MRGRRVRQWSPDSSIKPSGEAGAVQSAVGVSDKAVPGGLVRLASSLAAALTALDGIVRMHTFSCAEIASIRDFVLLCRLRRSQTRVPGIAFLRLLPAGSAEV